MKDQLHIYTRVSTDIQEDGTSLDNQRDTGLMVAKSNGWQPIIHDEGSHTSKSDDPMERPKLRKLLLDVKSGKVKRIFVWNLDRLTRNDRAAEIIKYDLQQNRVELYTALGKFDFDNLQDNLVFNILSALNQYENGLRAERSRQGKLRRLREGSFWKGGPPPFGFALKNKQLVVNNEEAKWVQFIFEQYRDGRSVEEIRKYLTANKVKTRRNNSIWSGASVNIILKGDAYRGFYTYTDRDPRTKEILEQFRINVPSFLDYALIKEVDDALERRSQKRVSIHTQKHTFLLKDFLFCETCDQVMYAKWLEKHSRKHYLCPTNERNYRRRGTTKERPKCSLGRLNIDETDDFIWQKLLDVLEHSHLFREETKKAVLGSQVTNEEHKKQLVSQRNKLAHLLSQSKKERTLLTLLNEMDDPDHAETIEKIQHQVKRLDDQIASIKSHIGRAETEKVWIDWVAKFGRTISDYRNLKSAEDRLPILQRFIEKIEVNRIDEQTKSLKFHFSFGYVDDDYDETTREVLSGNRMLDLRVNNEVLTKRSGRPKKNKPNHIEYSVTVE